MFGNFANKVRIKHSPETEKEGLSGKTGEIFGETTPSMMNLEIIGKPKRDYAINVYFEDLDKSFWFDEDLLECLDNGQGAEITLEGIDKKWVKGENGEWIEEDTFSTQKEQEKTKNKLEVDKKWWKFW